MRVSSSIVRIARMSERAFDWPVAELIAEYINFIEILTEMTGSRLIRANERLKLKPAFIYLSLQWYYFLQRGFITLINSRKFIFFKPLKCPKWSVSLVFSRLESNFFLNKFICKIKFRICRSSRIAQKFISYRSRIQLVSFKNSICITPKLKAYMIKKVNLFFSLFNDYFLIW